MGPRRDLDAAKEEDGREKGDDDDEAHPVRRVADVRWRVREAIVPGMELSEGKLKL
jgi:hypothetical protein